MSPVENLLLFDLSIGGHHPSYMEYLIAYWHQQQLPGQLSFVVAPEFPTVHKATVDYAHSLDAERIHFVAIAPAEFAALSPRNNGWTRAKRNFDEWAVFQKYAKTLKADYGLLLYFDTCFLPLAFGQSSPIPFGGIYFRPTFHYPSFAHYRPSRRDRFQHWREQSLLRRVLAHPQCRDCFSLDPYALEPLQQLTDRVKIWPLADPVRPFELGAVDPMAHRSALEIPAHRRLFLLFGSLTTRKGIYPLLEAIAQLPDQDCEQITFLFLGTNNIPDMQARVAAVTEAKPVKIIEIQRFFSQAELQGYIQASDVILAPYQNHVGMSGILIWAAMAGKPVLSSDYGLMGELVRRYQLGVAVDSTQGEAIALGLSQCLHADPATLANAEGMARFAALNDCDRFGETIFRALGYPISDPA